MVNKRCVSCGMEYPDHKMSCKDPVKEYRLPTAYEWLQRDESGVYSEMDICQAMVTFAKLHVEKALKEASEQAEIESERIVTLGGTRYEDSVSKDSILNSYPLENIK